MILAPLLMAGALALPATTEADDVWYSLEQPYANAVEGACDWITALNCESPVSPSGGEFTFQSGSVDLRLYEGTQVSNGINAEYLLETEPTRVGSGSIGAVIVCVSEDTGDITAVNSKVSWITWTRATPERQGWIQLDSQGNCGLGEVRHLLVAGTFSDHEGRDTISGFDPFAPAPAPGWENDANSIDGFSFSVNEAGWGDPSPYTNQTLTVTQTVCTGTYQSCYGTLNGYSFEYGVIDANGNKTPWLYANGSGTIPSACGGDWSCETRTSYTRVINYGVSGAENKGFYVRRYQGGAAEVTLGEVIWWPETADNYTPSESTDYNYWTMATLTEWELLEGLRFVDHIPGDNLATLDGMCTSAQDCISRCSAIDLACIFVPEVDFADFWDAYMLDLQDWPLVNDLDVVSHNLFNIGWQVSRVGGSCGVIFDGLDMSGVGNGLAPISSCDWPADVVDLASGFIGLIVVVGTGFAGAGLIFWMFDIPEPRWLRVDGVKD